MGDSYESKVSTVEQIGSSDTPVKGGLFVFPTNSPNGHTGIVESVNDDGSITVREANREARPD